MKYAQRIFLADLRELVANVGERCRVRGGHCGIVRNNVKERGDCDVQDEHAREIDRDGRYTQDGSGKLDLLKERHEGGSKSKPCRALVVNCSQRSVAEEVSVQGQALCDKYEDRDVCLRRP